MNSGRGQQGVEISHCLKASANTAFSHRVVNEVDSKVITLV